MGFSLVVESRGRRPRFFVERRPAAGFDDAKPRDGAR
jgi:hypothetical protein